MQVATEIVCTDRNKVLHAHITVCVCVSGDLYLYHHIPYTVYTQVSLLIIQANVT
jgi:hypothetical protein